MDPPSTPSSSKTPSPYYSGNIRYVWDVVLGKFVPETICLAYDPASDSHRAVDSSGNWITPSDPSPNPKANSRSRNRLSTLVDLESMDEVPGSTKEEVLALLNQFERKNLTRSYLLRALTGVSLEKKDILSRWDLHARALYEEFLKHWSDRQEFWCQNWDRREGEHIQLLGQLKKEVSDSKRDSKFQTKEAIEARNHLRQALDYGKTILKGEKVLQIKVDELLKEVERLRTDNLDLSGQLGVAKAAIAEADRLVAEEAARIAEEKTVAAAAAEARIAEEKTVAAAAEARVAEEKAVAAEATRVSAEKAVAAEATRVAAEKAVAPHQSNKCEDCVKVFSTRKQFMEHMNKSHNGKKGFKCTWNLCESAFSSRSRLERHKPVHTNETQFKCAVCDREFNQKGNLKGHELIHTDLKPYSCSECDQSFPRKSYLKKHMVKHTGMRPHKCSQCEKSFGQKGHLKTHMKSHKEDLLQDVMV